MENKEFISILDIASKFNTEEVLKEFLIFFCEYNIRFCKKNVGTYYPYIYNEKRETFLFSFNFFVSAIAKFYDVGNKQTEEKINSLLRLDSYSKMNKKEQNHAHRDRIFIFVSLLQEYYSVIFPNNKKIPSTRYKSSFNPTTSYYIPMVFEDKHGKPIQYEIVPSKLENLLAFGIPEDLINLMIELSMKNKLKDVAFNAKNCQEYWANSIHSKILRFE